MKRPFVFCIRCVPHFVLVVTLFLTFLSTREAVAQAVKAFPTAEGFGANTVGGRGGQVIYVTNLNDSGPGSLRSALQQPFPRNILFKVSGTIVLNSTIDIFPENSFFTLAGQTAPGGGIQIKNYPISMQPGSHDAIIRHIRFRPGTETFQAGGNGQDSIGINGYTFGDSVYNVIIDHCSFEWGSDENIDTSYHTTDLTVQWSITAEGSRQEDHSFGSLTARYGMTFGNEQRQSFHHNLYAQNMGRMPRVGTNCPRKVNEQLFDFRNNVIAAWGAAQGPMEPEHVLCNDFTPVPLNQFGGSPGNPILRLNVINNVFLPPSGSSAWPGAIGHVMGPSAIYMTGNSTFDFCPAGNCDEAHWDVAWISCQDQTCSNLANKNDYRVFSEHSVASVTTTPTSQVQSLVLNNVGATKPARDSLDTRIINETNNGTGIWGPFSGQLNLTINDYPTLAQGTVPQDTDNDGIPDTYELSHGSNPNDGSDGDDITAGGYTRLENYLNELAGDSIPGVGQSPVPTHLRIIAVTP
jgi:Bacterial TSP3 repeat